MNEHGERSWRSKEKVAVYKILHEK
jgi:hypothetical protein